MIFCSFLSDLITQHFGLQVPRKDSRALRAFLDGLGYPYVDESANPVYGLFLR